MRARNHYNDGGSQRQKQFNCGVESLAVRAEEVCRWKNDATSEVSGNVERSFSLTFRGRCGWSHENFLVAYSITTIVTLHKLSSMAESKNKVDK